jgi:signal transduction histidine kinase/ligand-binding sensor domain-containing protein
VISLVQTRDGYIWAGTFGGVARFDGVRFQVFNKENTPELPGNAITGLFEAHDGALLVCTAAGGIAAVREGKFELLLKDQMEGDDIVAAAKDRMGGTTLSSLSGLLWRWEGGRLSAVCSSRESGPLRFGPIHPGVLCEDESGGLWTLGRKGSLLHLIDHKWERANLEGKLGGQPCNALVRDSNSQLWLGTDQGLYALRKGCWEPAATEGIQDPVGVRDVFAGRDGEVWLASSDGNRSGYAMVKSGRRLASAEDFASKEADIYPLGEDAFGGLCLGSFANGFYRISADGETTHLDRQNGLPGNSVRCYLLDREGNEWLGLDDGGLVRLRPRKASLFASTPEAQVATYSVCADHEGTIWVGTSSEGLFRSQQGDLKPFDARAGHGLGSILSVFEDSSNHLWVGTYGDGLFLREGNKFVQVCDPALLGGRVRAIYEDKRHRLWLGCRAGLAYLENGKVNLLPAPAKLGEFEIQSLAEDSQNRLWAGTRGKGLLCVSNNQWSAFHTNDGLINDNVLALLPNEAGSLWIGTAGGLSLLSGGKFASTSTKSGLPADTLCHIAQDGKGNLWFSSSQGVFSTSGRELEAFLRREKKTVRWNSCGVADGLPTRECTGGSQPSGWTTSDGRLLIPTIKGLSVVKLGATAFNALPPPILIEEVSVDGVQSGDAHKYQDQWDNLPPFSMPHPVSSMVIPPGKNRMAIRYTALSFVAPEKVRFKVRLEPREDNWIDVGSQRHVDYSFLRPGNYLFRVIACNSDGVWNSTGAVFAFTLLPHFWQTSAFTLLWVTALTSGIAGLVAYIARRRHSKRLAKIEQLRMVENERARIARDIHDDLGSSLTEIGLLCALAVRESTPPTTARGQVLRIMERSAELARTLDETVWALNPKNDSLGRLATYLCQFAKEFLEPTGIRCRLDRAGDLPEVPLSAETRHNVFLVLKEALNNAVRHSGATEIWLRMAEQGPTFCLEVADNGKGFDAAKLNEPGNGLRNMARRMEAIGGTFKLQSTHSDGTTICLRLPLPPGSGVSDVVPAGGTTQLGDAPHVQKR